MATSVTNKTTMTQQQEQYTKNEGSDGGRIIEEGQVTGISGGAQLPPKPKASIGSRHIFVFMAFLGLSSVYLMRTNLSVAIVDMIKTTPSPPDNNTANGNSSSFLFGIATHHDDEDDYSGIIEAGRLDHQPLVPVGPLDNNKTEHETKQQQYSVRAAANNASDFCEPDDSGSSSSENANGFDWNKDEKGLILGAFYWGYMVTQIPGGILAERYGGKIVFGIGIALTTLCCLLTPLAAHGGVGTMVAIRVMTGLSEGVTFPTANSMISKWVPSAERTTLGAFVLAGTQFGTVISLPLSGWLCSFDWLDGWPLAFYVPGVVGVLWLVGWFFLVHDNPQVHPTIAPDERLYILATTGASTKRKSAKETPWLSIFGSIHFWAILVAHFGHSWGFTMLLTELPSYMNEVLQFDLKANGLLSALPYLAMWLFSIAFSVTADALRSNQILSTTITRKVFTTIGLLLPACGLIGASFTGCDRVATLTLLTLATGFNGAVYSGFLVNHIDIASNHAGSMMGMTNCVGSICGFVAPSIVGLIVYTKGSLAQWQTVFFLSAGIYAVTDLFYVIFGTGVEQPWNKLTVAAAAATAAEGEREGEGVDHKGISTITAVYADDDSSSSDSSRDGDDGGIRKKEEGRDGGIDNVAATVVVDE